MTKGNVLSIISIDQALLFTLGMTMVKHGKRYCFPSQETILQHLRDYYGITVSRRALNYHLKMLEEQGYILRTQRKKYLGNGQWRQRSTLYKFKGKAVKFIASLGNGFLRVGKFFRVHILLHHKSSVTSVTSTQASFPYTGYGNPSVGPDPWEDVPDFTDYTRRKASG